MLLKLFKKPSNLMTLGFTSVLLAAFLLGKLPIIVIYLYAFMSSLAFLLYGWDKYAAIKGWRRTRERTLHLVGLLSGWPGAAVAQHGFRHKTKKAKFRRLYWLTVITNLICFSWLYNQQDAPWLKSIQSFSRQFPLV